MTRSKRLFDHFGAPPWSSFVPTSRHALGRFADLRLFELSGYRERMTECASYLGLITLGSLLVAALRRVEFPRRGYWWSVFALLVILSWGSRQDLFGASVSLPAGWIYNIFPPFHLIRVPARFNLFAAAVAVVPAAAGLQAIIGRFPRHAVRVGLLAFLTGLTVTDLAMVPFPTAAIPDPPSIYAQIHRDSPNATVLDAPLFDSTRGQTYSSLWGYWQQRTGLATSGGYPGLTNTRFDAEIAHPSVFESDRLRYGQTRDRFGRDGELDVRDRAWLELTAHHFDRVFLHNLGPDDRWQGQRRLPATLEQAIGNITPDGVVLDRGLLDLPRTLTWMTDQGWRPLPTPHGAEDSRSAAFRDARIMVYQPAPGSVVLSLEGAEAFADRRVVQIVEDGRKLAHFPIEVGEPQTVIAPLIPLSPGLHAWTIQSDGATKPTRSADRVDDAATPYSFRLNGVRLRAEPPR